MHLPKHLTVSLLHGVWLWGTLAYAAGDFQRETLRALPGVWVVVEHVGPELTQTGLTQAELQQDTEEKIRAAGIPLLRQEECWQTPGMPWLYLTVALLKVTDTTYAATIAANLYQEVQVLRSPPLKTFGVTWDAGVHVGAVSTEQLASLRHLKSGHIYKVASRLSFVCGVSLFHNTSTWSSS